MTYWKVKEYDDYYKGGTDVLVKNELKTETEMKREGLSLDDPRFVKIVAQPKNTYWFFGSRFAD